MGAGRGVGVGVGVGVMLCNRGRLVSGRRLGIGRDEGYDVIEATRVTGVMSSI